eukprot:c22986_g4_i1 orf=178-1710(+)
MPISIPFNCMLLGAVIWFSGALSYVAHGSKTRYYDFKVGFQQVTKLCKSRNIITVNGKFPGPTLYAQEGDRVIVKVTNSAKYNVTIHWHGVRQHFSCWSDGPSYITQCPIQPGNSFTYEFTLYQQKGTLLWHAHISWLRATVHGAIVIYPMTGVPYPFTFPYEEHVIIIGEYWNADIEVLENQTLASGGAPPLPDAYTINGHPGPLYNCSAKDTYILNVVPGKMYLLRIINVALDVELFFGIAEHKLRVVSVDGCYTKPFETKSVPISPGQTTDVLLTTDQSVGRYYMGISPYMFANVSINTVLGLAVLKYTGSSDTSSIPMPNLPGRNDSNAQMKFLNQLRSLSTPDAIVSVPQTIDRNLFFTLGLNQKPCPSGQICKGPTKNTKFSASVNNITFQRPDISILQAYYYSINGSYTPNFPDQPPRPFDYTGTSLRNVRAMTGTRVSVIAFNSNVQLVLQDTSLTSTENHPIHLHGFSFYVVGFGLGNFQASSAGFNLVDPPMRNTIGVPA